MTMDSVALRVTLAAVLWCLPMEALGKEMKLRVKYSGSVVTRQDSNKDRINAGFGILTGESNLGPCTAQGVGEALSAGSGNCPNGHPGLLYTVMPGTGHGFIRFDRKGDMLFSRVISETACYDLTTGVLTKSGTNEITGGTGRFVGATGQTKFEGTQWLLYIDPDGNAFAAQEGASTGTIVLQRTDEHLPR